MPETGTDLLLLGQLEGYLGFHLRMASAAVARDFAIAIKPIDLTQKQIAVLELISCNSNVSQIDLAESLGTDRATMMALVDRLEERSLVSRQVSAVDRRRKVLILTRTGKELLVEARRRIGFHERRVRRSIGSDAKCNSLVEGLRALY